MLELLFVIGFFVMLLMTGISLLGILAAIVVATVVMFIGGLFAPDAEAPAVAAAGHCRGVGDTGIKSPKLPTYQRNNPFSY